MCMSKKLKNPFTSSINIEVHLSCAKSLEEKRNLVTLMTIFLAKILLISKLTEECRQNSYVKCCYSINFANIIIPAVDLMLTSFHLAKQFRRQLTC